MTDSAIHGTMGRNLDLYSILKQLNAYNNRSKLDVKPINTYLGIHNIRWLYFVTNGGMFIDIFYFLIINTKKEF